MQRTSEMRYSKTTHIHIENWLWILISTKSDKLKFHCTASKLNYDMICLTFITYASIIVFISPFYLEFIFISIFFIFFKRSRWKWLNYHRCAYCANKYLRSFKEDLFIVCRHFESYIFTLLSYCISKQFFFPQYDLFLIRKNVQYITHAFSLVERSKCHNFTHFKMCKNNVFRNFNQTHHIWHDIWINWKSYPLNS